MKIINQYLFESDQLSTTNHPSYERPYNVKQLKKKHSKLLKDPAHLWRAETGIELIHKEPDLEELERIWKNWQLMSKHDKILSEKKSKELFGLTNKEHYKQLKPLYK
jgi:hypothetical protein